MFEALICATQPPKMNGIKNANSTKLFEIPPAIKSADAGLGALPIRKQTTYKGKVQWPDMRRSFVILI